MAISLPVQDAEDIAETCSGHIFVATKVCGGLTAMEIVSPRKRLIQPLEFAARKLGAKKHIFIYFLIEIDS